MAEEFAEFNDTVAGFRIVGMKKEKMCSGGGSSRFFSVQETTNYSALPLSQVMPQIWLKADGIGPKKYVLAL